MAITQLNHTQEMLSNIPSIFDVRRKTCFAELTTCTPAIVYKVGEEDDDEAGVVYVIPLIKKSYADGVSEEKKIVKTTLATTQHGGFHMRAPVFVGDTGWLLSADGDTEGVKQNNCAILDEDVLPGAVDDNEQLIANAGPVEPDLPKVHHSFTHGFFLPDKWGGVPMPDEFMDSFVIEQVKKDGDSKGRFVMDPDGTIRIFSTRWYEQGEKRSGKVLIDLKWNGKTSAKEKSASWKLGDFQVDGNSLLQGDVEIGPWEDDDGKKHGGNLHVVGNGIFDAKVEVAKDLSTGGDLQIGGKSNFAKRMVVMEDNKAVIIDPKMDLHKTDAKFREVMVVTGLEHDKNSSNKVALQVKKMRVLGDLPENRDPIEFEVGGGGGGGSVETDQKSIEFNSSTKLQLYDWNNSDSDSPYALEDAATSENDVYVVGRTGDDQDTLQYFKLRNQFDRGAFYLDYVSKRSDNKIVVKNCCVRAGRTLVHDSVGLEIAKNFTGTVYAILEHPNDGNMTLTTSTTPQNNTLELTCLELYSIQNGLVVYDYRNAPTVPLYE